MTEPEIKICYALWDRVHHYDNPGIQKILVDTNFALDSILMPVIDSDLMEMVRWAADETDYTHIVVFDTGTVMTNSDLLRKAWHDLCEKDWMVAGHVMWRTTDAYPWLHPQCFGINLDRWKATGRPDLGDGDNVTRSLHSAERSPDNVHDDYTPLWLMPGSGTAEISKTRFGWNAIDASMRHGLRVENLSMDIRIHKMFIYPDDQPQRMIDIIRCIREGAPCDVDAVENDTQRRFFKNQQWASSDTGIGSVFVFNTGDALVNTELWDPPGAIWATASGFKPFLEWFYRSRSKHCSINLFDYNQRSLDLWELIQTHWNGIDLYGFVKQHRSDCDDENYYCWGNKYDHETPEQASTRQESLLHDFCGGRDIFISAWNEYKSLAHAYHQINLVADPRRFAKLLSRNTMNYIWINNIFYFNRSIRRYGITKLCDSLREMLEQIVDDGIQNKICGQSANAHFFDSADAILPELLANPTPLYQCQLEFRNTGVRRWAGHPLAF